MRRQKAAYFKILNESRDFIEGLTDDEHVSIDKSNERIRGTFDVLYVLK